MNLTEYKYEYHVTDIQSVSGHLNAPTENVACGLHICPLHQIVQLLQNKLNNLFIYLQKYMSKWTKKL